jgi:hypothetical protein
MQNPNVALTLASTGGPLPCVVLDDALLEPQGLVELAQLHQAAFAWSAANAFPGRELPLPAPVVEGLARQFEPSFAAPLGVETWLDGHGRLSVVSTPPAALRPLQRVCHRDRLALAPDERIVAAVLYLFHDAALGGTSFFQARQDAARTEALMQQLAQARPEEADALLGASKGYLTASNAHFEHVTHVLPRWNRMIFYDGGQFHGSHVNRPELLVDDPARGRLTLNLFLRYRRSP